MLEDDLKISSDEEEAEQKVSSLCSLSIHSAVQIIPHSSFASICPPGIHAYTYIIFNPSL